MALAVSSLFPTASAHVSGRRVDWSLGLCYCLNPAIRHFSNVVSQYYCDVWPAEALWRETLGFDWALLTLGSQNEALVLLAMPSTLNFRTRHARKQTPDVEPSVPPGPCYLPSLQTRFPGNSQQSPALKVSGVCAKAWGETRLGAIQGHLAWTNSLEWFPNILFLIKTRLLPTNSPFKLPSSFYVVTTPLSQMPRSLWKNHRIIFGGWANSTPPVPS